MVIDIVLTFALGRGGLENVITIISNELTKRGHRVRVMQAVEPIYSEWRESIDEFYVFDSSIEYNDTNPEWTVERYKEFLLREGKPDIILCTHVPVMTYICCKALALSGLLGTIPLISWIHGSVYCYRGNNEELMSFADAHFAISKEIQSSLKKMFNNKPVYLVNNPVDVDKELIERDTEKLNIIYVGRLTQEKKVDTILKAVSKLKGNWQLNVYGDGEEGQELVEMSYDLNIQDNIRWHGWRDDPWGDIDKGDILINSSEYEGFGMVIIEALCRGIPVAASKTGGALNSIEDGVNGWLFDVDDYNQLSEILNRVQTDKSILPSREVCKKSVEKYSTRNVVDNFENYILKECSKKKELSSENSLELIRLIEDIEKEIELEDNLASLNKVNIKQIRKFMIMHNTDKYILFLNKVAIINYNLENYDYVFPYLQIAYEMNNDFEETLYNLSVMLYNVQEYKMALNYLKNIRNRSREILELKKLISDKIKN